MKTLGKAWIVLEESFHSNKKRLVAVLSHIKTVAFVAEYIEHAYVDRFACFDEKITFKKDKKKSPFKMERYTIRNTIIHHWHAPIFNAYYAHKLKREGGNFLF